jgi:hypothetical protein
VAQLFALSTPAVFMAAAFAQTTLVRDDSGFPRASAQSFSVYALWVASGVGMVGSAMVFHRKTIRSRYFLKQQGLAVPRTPPVIVPALATIGVLSAMSASAVETRGGQVRTSGLALGLGLYAISVGVGTYQLDLNRRARRDAGWIGLAPALDPRAPGLALAGTW